MLPQDLYRGFLRKGANIGSMDVGRQWTAVVDMLIATSFVVVETGRATVENRFQAIMTR